MLVKICGLTLAEDALFAARAGADFLGVVMAEKSKRRATIDQARAIIALNVSQAKYLVFGYDNASYIEEVFRAVAMPETRLQLFADHPDIDALSQLVSVERFLPAISGAIAQSDETLSRWKDSPFVLIDSPGGGTGKAFEHGNVSSVTRPYLLAGGLTPENVAGIVAKINPTGVDVASGVESAPGKKSHEAIQKFIHNARSSRLAGGGNR